MDKKVTAMNDEVRGKHPEVFAPNNRKILEIIRVSKHFGELKALVEVSFEVAKGEILGIAGPNGAGKTTLFNVIAGKLRGSGDVVFDGTNISGLQPHQICHEGIARTFQIPVLFSTLSVFENVKIGAHFGPPGTEARDSEEKATDDVIDFVGLGTRKKAIAGNLDLFDKKLTMLAAAISTKPRLLLLDEPIGGLSPREIKESVDLIFKLKEELGLTVVIIEHLMPILARVSDRLMILDNGQKICIAPPEHVIRDPRVREVYLGESYA